jgi:hypothetical protein
VLICGTLVTSPSARDFRTHSITNPVTWVDETTFIIGVSSQCLKECMLPIGPKQGPRWTHHVQTIIETSCNCMCTFDLCSASSTADAYMEMLTKQAAVQKNTGWSGKELENCFLNWPFRLSQASHGSLIVLQHFCLPKGKITSTQCIPLFPWCIPYLRSTSTCNPIPCAITNSRSWVRTHEKGCVMWADYYTAAPLPARPPHEKLAASFIEHKVT